MSTWRLQSKTYISIKCFRYVIKQYPSYEYLNTTTESSIFLQSSYDA